MKSFLKPGTTKVSNYYFFLLVYKKMMIKRKRKMNTKVTVLAEEEEGVGVGEKKRFHRITIACFLLRRSKKNCGIKK
jgi:hypothetical protein